MNLTQTAYPYQSALKKPALHSVLRQGGRKSDAGLRFGAKPDELGLDTLSFSVRLQTPWEAWSEKTVLPETRDGLLQLKRQLSLFSDALLSEGERHLKGAVGDIADERLFCLNALGRLKTQEPMGKVAYQQLLRREGFQMTPEELEQALSQHSAKALHRLKDVFPSESLWVTGRRLAQDFPQFEASLLKAYHYQLTQAERLIRTHDLLTVPQSPLAIQLERVENDSVPAEYDLNGRRLILRKQPAASGRHPLASHLWSKIPMLVAHEVMPGHHVAMVKQIGDVKALLPADVGANSFFREGWATYAEQLMQDHGLMDTPEKQFALRWHQWELAETARENVAHHCGAGKPVTEPEWQARYNQERYDRAAYYLGYLQLLNLRKQVLAANPDMSLRTFHDRLLSCPELPFPRIAKLAFNLDLKPLDAESLRALAA